MGSTSAEMPEFSTARTVPAHGTTRLHPNLTFLDIVRIALLLIIPIYARIYLFSSVLIAFGHVYVISTTCICIVYFSKEMMSLRAVWDIVYGLLVSSFPNWGASLLEKIWDETKFQGWRWEVVYWTWVAMQLSYLLPEYYGSDVKVLIREYHYAYPRVRSYIYIISGVIVYFALWPKGCPWQHAILVLEIISSFIEYGCLLSLNYAHLQKTGKTVRQDSWPYKDMYVKTSTLEEWIRWHRTGSTRAGN